MIGTTLARFLLVLALLVAALPAGGAHAASARLDPRLSNALADARATDLLRVVVTFDAQPGSATLGAVRGAVTRFQALSALPMALVRATPAQVDALRQVAGVRSLYLDRKLDYFLQESVPLIGADRAWRDPGVTGEGVGVAVLDSGVDGTHPDLPYGAKVVQNVRIVGEDDTAPELSQVIEGVPNSDTSSGHGTHVAGTVAGLGRASESGTERDLGEYGYYTGVAPGADIIGVGAGDAIFIFTALTGFDWIMQNREEYGIRVISNSWGTSGAFDPADPINIASKAAHDAGMTVVFAAGNSGPGTDTLNPYSVAPWVIGVAAGNKDGTTLADFSSRGRYGDPLYHPAITAPGVGIVAARANNTVLPPLAATDDASIRPEWLPYYTTMSGTSMATPHVSGVVALLLEANPNLTPDVVKRVLVNTATPMPQYEEYAAGAGYVDAYAAVQEARSIRRIRAYKDPKTGKTAQVYVKETAFSGEVAPAVAGYNSLSRDSADIAVDPTAVFLDVKVTWDNPVNDLDLFLFDPAGAQAGASQDVQALSGEGREGVAINYPAAGRWRAETRGWLSAPQAYEGVAQQYIPVR